MKSFEERLARLEELAEGIRDRDLPIEEAMEKFEEGAALSKDMEKELSAFERRIEILVNDPEDGEEARTEPFDPEA